MNGAWVAASVRGRALVGRRLGREGARALAAGDSVPEAIAGLARTPYGREVRAGMDLASAEHGVAAVLLWHLRILAGWAPSGGAERVRLLASGFEISNVTGRLDRLVGRTPGPVYEVGALSTIWPRAAVATTPAELRHLLATSAWGDPGSTEPAEVRTYMQLCWASRVFDGVPEAESWAVAYVTLSAARALVTGIPPAPTAEAERHLRHVLGERAARAASLPELADRVTGTTRRVLADVSGPDDLWRAEARFWRDVEAEAVGLAGASRPGPGVAVGAVGLLAADAWRARAALEILARGRSMAAEVFDAVA